MNRKLIGLREREAFEIDCEIQEKITAREQRRREALDRAGRYEGFPEAVKKYFLQLEKATGRAERPQERTDPTNL